VKKTPGANDANSGKLNKLNHTRHVTKFIHTDTETDTFTQAL